MSKYAEAKSQPDWMDVTARQIRGTIKATIVYSGIRHQNKDQVLYPLHKKIDEFVEEIEDAVLAQQFKAELYQYAEDLWQKTIQAVGNLTPFQFAQALTAKTYISDEQAQASFNLGETATRVATFIAESNGALAYGNATSMQTYNVEVQKRVKEFMQDLSYMSKYTDSAPNARNIAEMTLRYEKTQADLQELKGKGTKFVYIPPHANCSARCQKWQGRIYSLDGTTGEIDGRKYVPLETATEVYWHSKRTGKDYPNGLFAYNCRHKAEPYHRGQNIETIPDDVIERAREIEEQQRKMEREYREMRSDELNLRAVAKATGNAEILKQAQALRKRSIQLRKNYVKFSEKNGMVYYPERLKVVEGEYSAPVMPSSPAPAPQVTPQAQISPIQQAQTALTKDEIDALTAYKSGNGMWINNYLRGLYNFEISSEEKEYLNDLDNATKREIKGIETLYRSVDASAIFGDISNLDYENLKGFLVYGLKDKIYTDKITKIINNSTGKTITDKGFMSTTKSLDFAIDFEGFTGSEKPIVIELEISKNTKGIDMSIIDGFEEDEQEEVLLARNQSYKIKSIESANGSIYVKCKMQ